MERGPAGGSGGAGEGQLPKLWALWCPPPPPGMSQRSTAQHSGLSGQQAPCCGTRLGGRAPGGRLQRKVCLGRPTVGSSSGGGTTTAAATTRS